MFLASINIFGPIARMGMFIIQKSTNAQLFRGSSIPACPVTGAWCFMPENTIQPITMIRLHWSVWNCQTKNHSEWISNDQNALNKKSMTYLLTAFHRNSPNAMDNRILPSHHDVCRQKLSHLDSHKVQADSHCHTPNIDRNRLHRQRHALSFCMGLLVPEQLLRIREKRWNRFGLMNRFDNCMDVEMFFFSF